MPSDYSNLTGNWNYPNSIKAGAGAIKDLPAHCKALGMSSPLLITDPGLAVLPMTQNCVEHCRATGLNCAVFSEMKLNPTDKNVSDGVVAYKAGGHDGVIAFGGGSGLDVAKAVALMVGQDRPIFDFEDVGDNWTRVDTSGVAPVIAVPTTAGTGSEVGRASIITDEANHVKKIIFHPSMLPKLAILDPELTVCLPAHITAATGMDALSHNLEALCSPFYHPMAEGIAIEGIRIVKDYLPRAVADGSDLEARIQMLVASSMGATAFQKGLGGMHALAHPLGALYDAHHGLLNAILMPYVLKLNRKAIETRVTRLACYLALKNPSFDSFLQWVLDLREQVGIPNDLSGIGIPEKDLALIGTMASEDPSADGNPITLSPAQYTDLCRNALHGTL
jgi:alcohol dehydrogenase class IV|tara:strand:- start:1049 stop:2224 length:1176 start_codon:yes stop_codon:yes gene_type:complete